MSTIPIRRALVSVSDKMGIVEFATCLKNFGVEIISTGGTSKILRQHQIPVTEIQDFTQYPEILGGRVKTLHPQVLGGILAQRQVDQEEMEKLHLLPIDLVVVNLYPFQEVIAQQNHILADGIENIDIGGVTLIRAAAKNFQDVAVIVDSAQYQTIATELANLNGALTSTHRFHLAQQAFAYIANYDANIANYFATLTDNGSYQLFPNTLSTQLYKLTDLRYGENPHQRAALYADRPNAQADTQDGVVGAKQIQGKPLSFNNIIDADTAWECARSFSADPVCVIVKHANPCGVALGENLLEAYQRAYSADPSSAFGGIIAVNRPMDSKTAELIVTQQFVELIIAPALDEAALTILQKKPNLRILQCRVENITSSPSVKGGLELFDCKRITGGFVIQDWDTNLNPPCPPFSKGGNNSSPSLKRGENNSFPPLKRGENNSFPSLKKGGEGGFSKLEKSFETVTQRTPTEKELRDLHFAWQVAKFVKSNAVVYAKDGLTVGIGAGQTSRIYSARIGVMKAQEQGFNLQSTVMASDGFFPFRDSVDAAAQVGVTAIIQPGGSIRDEEVIQAANEANIAMIFTGIRHFRH